MVAKLKIAVIGAGISGLAVASLLRQQDHAVSIFEKFDEPRPLGSGLLLQQTGLAVLARLGLDHAAIAQGAKITRFWGVSSHDRAIFDLEHTNLNSNCFSLGIHRHSLFELLYDKARLLGVDIVSSFQTVDVINENSRCRLVAADQRQSAQFDLVLDASGVRSKVRDQCAVVKDSRSFAYGALWSVCERPDGYPMHILQQRFHWAKHGIGLIPIGRRPGSGDKQHVAMHWGIRHADYEAWRSQPFAKWKRAVIDLFPDVAPVVEQFTSHDQFTLAYFHEIVLKRLYNGRIAFIGDAGHALSPRLGQGANLGLIDAFILSRALAAAHTIDEALIAYDRERRNHVRFYQWAGQWMARMFQSDSLILPILRDIGFYYFSRVPYVRQQMLITICGVKTGLFSSLEPGLLHENYNLSR